jgi:hypothetical protein
MSQVLVVSCYCLSIVALTRCSASTRARDQRSFIVNIWRRYLGIKWGHAYPQSVGRPSLSVGTAGRVRTYRTGTGWRARTLYRDYDGITRDLERAGRTRGAAERALAEALRDRVRISGTDVISGDTRVAVLYKTWSSQLVDHSPTTTAAYEYIANRHIIPALGSLRVRELSVGTIHRFLRSVADHHGAATAKICRSCRAFAASRPVTMH